MAEVLYQRAEPRQKEWLPLLSQQIRLRNLVQILLINGPDHDSEDSSYFTLHSSPMSAPFYTSSKVRGNKERVTSWPEIQTSHCSTRLSAPSCIIRVWTSSGSPLLSWGLHFKGLHYLGGREDLSPSDFKTNTLIFITPFGSFTSLCSTKAPPVGPQRFLRVKIMTETPSLRSSYTLKNLVALHHLQRSVLEEHTQSEKLRMDVGIYGFRIGGRLVQQQQASERLVQRSKIGRERLRLREEIEVMRMKVLCLTEEKGRAEGRLRRLKQQCASYDEMSADLISRLHNFNTEKVNLKETKAALITKGQMLGKFRASVFIRKKQLISELLQIYPLELIEGSRKYSINGVQLPNAEDYGSETGGQISVALGYTAHLAAMLAFFLDIPCRYPIRHFGSRSRIIDHITVQMADREREFPLYFKGRRDVYCAYAIYLLNKNIAQIRWYCGLSTPDLRATLPNLVELLSSRLIIPGWPPNLGEALEIAQEITEDIDSHFLENELTMSLDKGLDRMSDMGTDDGGNSENPGGNSAALGEIKHGRGQERFLSGWKNKKYAETDDFDPKWLMDSMNLDFESGRRLSMSNSSPPPRPIFIITDDAPSSGGGGSRRRRVGRVENNIEEGKAVGSVPLPLPQSLSPQDAQGSGDLKRTYTPSREIARLELDIKEFERRKSRGQASTLGVPTSTASRSGSTESLPQIPPQAIENAGQANANEDWVSSESSDDKNGKGNDEGDNTINGVIPQVQHAEACNPNYHIPPPVVEVIPTEKIEIDPEKRSLQDNNVGGTISAVSVPVNGAVKDCDIDSKISKEDKEATTGSSNAEDSLLWMRTEALLESQSFNLVRRRMSASEST